MTNPSYLFGNFRNLRIRIFIGLTRSCSGCEQLYVFTTYHVYRLDVPLALGRVPEREDVVAAPGVILDPTVTTALHARVPLATKTVVRY